VKIGPAAIAAAIALSTASSLFADAPPPGTLAVRVIGLRSSAGQVGCTLYDSPKGFPADATAAMKLRWCPIDKQASRCAFDPIPAGVYAVACFHDENGNGKFDTGFLGIPKEGVAFSNDAKGFMGPPSFKAASFSFSESREIGVRMGYF
jgi:uncharacterized protein (DUF2141 family)